MPAPSSSPSALTTVLAAVESPSAPLSAADSIRLLHALRSVPDPRRALINDGQAVGVYSSSGQAL